MPVRRRNTRDKVCSFFAKIIWRQPNRVGLAVRTMVTDAPAASDLDARLRRSERKKRKLQRRIKRLIGEGRDSIPPAASAIPKHLS